MVFLYGVPFGIVVGLTAEKVDKRVSVRTYVLITSSFLLMLTVPILVLSIGFYPPLTAFTVLALGVSTAYAKLRGQGIPEAEQNAGDRRPSL